MKNFEKIPLLGAIFYLSLSAHAAQNNSQEPPRPKRSFGSSNPIFSRVFNPYDDRPLAQKFLGYDPGSPREGGPQFYPLWHSQPILQEADSEENHQDYSALRNYPSRRTFGQWYPESSKPRPETEKPYPPPSKPSQPYPEAGRPYPPPFKPSQPYPEAGKPYPPPSKPSQLHPESGKPSKHQTNVTDPCVDPSKPYPASHKPHQTSGKSPIGRLFVDEVDKTLKFVKDPETGELVPVISDGKTNKPRRNEFVPDLMDLIAGFQYKGPDYYEPTTTTTTTTTARSTTEREYRFKLLPNYDIKTKFDSTTQKPELNEISDNLEKAKKLREESEENQRLQKLLIKFEEKRRKLIETFYGTDESKWPSNPFQSMLDEVKKSRKDYTSSSSSTQKPFVEITPGYSTTTLKPIVEVSSRPLTATTARPAFVLPNLAIRNTFFEEAPKFYSPFLTTQPKVTKKPCTNKTTQARPLRFNIHVKVAETPKNTPFTFKITPHSRLPEGYTQFLAPPAYVTYQKFNFESSTLQPITTTSNQKHQTKFYRIQPDKRLPFRVFNEKLDQSVLDKLKDPITGKIDGSKLEKLTHVVYVEPVNKKRLGQRTQLQTLENKPLDVVSKFAEEVEDRFEPFESNLASTPYFDLLKNNSSFPSTMDQRTIFFRPNSKIYKYGVDSEISKYLEQDLKSINVGHIPLDRHEIWDVEKRVLTDSYGRKIRLK